MTAAEFNLAQVCAAVAAANPDRDCIVFGDRRFTFAQTDERARRFARALHQWGLGARRERSELAPHESGQSHIGLYLANCNEFLEAMLGAYKARVAPFNVNYRYVAGELVYLLQQRRRRRGGVPRAIRADAWPRPWRKASCPGFG